MADAMDEYQALSERLSRHWRRLTDQLRADPDLHGGEETRECQALFNQVTEVMHLMSHAQHALSDLMLNFDRPRPRVLRASPFIFPLPVQTTITATGPPVRLATSRPPRASVATSQAPPPPPPPSSAASATASPSSPMATMHSATSEQRSGQHLQQHLQEHAHHVQAAQGGNVTSSTNATEAAQQLTTQGHNAQVAQVPMGAQVIGPIVVGIPVDVATPTQPGGGGGGGGGGTAAGASSSGRPMQQNILDSILRPALNGIAGGGVGDAGGMGFGIMTSASTTAQGTAAVERSTVVQDTTARQSTQTHPTASTRTPRATPHVHFPPSSQALGLGLGLGGGIGYGSQAAAFDPFLPCQSHHVAPQRTSPHPARRVHQRPRSASVPPRNNNSNSNLPESGGQERGSRVGGGSPQLGQRRFVAAAPHPGFVFAPPPMGTGGRGWVVNTAGPPAHFVPLGPPPPGHLTPSPPPPPEAVLDPSLQGLLNQLRANNSGSQDEANMINMVQGILGQVIGALGGGGGGPGVGGTVADFLNGLPDYHYTEGESTLTDFLMTLARNLSFGDLIPLVLGQGDVRVNQLQEPLNHFIRTRVLQTEIDNPSDEVSDSFNLRLKLVIGGGCAIGLKK